MANPNAGNKCADAGAAMRTFRLSPDGRGGSKRAGRSKALLDGKLREIPGEGRWNDPAPGDAWRPLPREESAQAHFFAASLACLMQSERNFLRSLPCSPLSSACFEQSSDSGLCAFSAFFSVLAAGVDVAGAPVVPAAGPSWGIAAFSCFGAALGSCPRLVRPLRETKDDVSSKAIVRSGGGRFCRVRGDRAGAGADHAGMQREIPGRQDRRNTERPEVE